MSTALTNRRELGVAERAATLDWQQIVSDLDSYGCAVAKGVLTPEECHELSSCYDHDEHFRSRIVMAWHGFGRGEYKYWAYPLPKTIETLRTTLYPQLAVVANRWNQIMKIDVRYPATHAAFLEQCHRAGQVRPTPLLLQYDEGDFNCLHQDVYGDLVFPLQVAFLLSVPGEDFTGVSSCAIAVSHPHFYTTMAEWGRVFGDVPIYLHNSNKSWVKRSDAPIRFWDKERISLNDEMSLIRVGGHFEGSTVLHWSGTADRKGALLVGDSIYVVRDRRWVTFMRSYPNLIPLPGKIVQQVADAVADLPFERLYGHFWESLVTKDAKNVLLRSVQRYLHALAPAI